jgi:hypothetical protein
MSEQDKPQPPRLVVEPDRGRRRVLMGGLASAPVLMTLVSRPVLGQAVCVTPSAFISGNASVVGAAVVCEGHTPDYWVDAPSWPDPFTPDTPFNDVFGPNSQYACDTLLDVVSPTDTGPADILPPEQPAPPASGHGHKHHQDRVRPSPKAREEPSRGFGLSRGSFKPISQKTLNLGASDRHKLYPGPLDDAALGPRGHKHVHRRNGQGQGEGTDGGAGQVLEPPVSDPGPVDPLGCNDNTAPAPLEPSSPDPSSPAPPSLGGRRRRSKRRGLRSPTRQDALARYIVAALLNAQAGLTPAVTVHTVRGIWKEYTTQGYFEPTAGVHWGLEEIVTYLASTQPV